MEDIKILSNQTQGMPVVNYHAAGIDVGSTEMWVTYTNLSGETCQFRTGCFTRDLEALVKQLLIEGVTDVAMESTGIYGDPLRNMLENGGIRVTVINPSHYKKPEVKTDGKDSIWLHQYHSVDLFRMSHYAPECWRELREYIQERDSVQRHKSVSLVKIQRQLSMMNVKLQHCVSDIEGVSPMRVVRAISLGETDPEKLVSLMDVWRFKKNTETLKESLRGDFRQGLVNVLKEQVEEYDFYVRQMRKYDKYISDVLEQISRMEELKRSASEVTEEKKTTQVKARKNEYSFDGAKYLKRILNIDLTKIEGLDEKTLLIVLSVTGIDMNKWVNVRTFVSWLSLTPRPKISNGKRKGHEKRKTTNPATLALRVAARSLHDSDCRLGHLYRKLCLRKVPRAANNSVARHLATLIYTLIKNKTEYDKKYFEEEKRQQRIREERRFFKMADKLGYEVVGKCS
jgi:transposase